MSRSLSIVSFTNLGCSGYIGEFEIIDDHRSGKIVIQLNGRLNKTGVISPRFNVQATQIESWVNLLLPARSFGIIILVSGLVFLCQDLAQRFLDDVFWHSRSRRSSPQKHWREATGLCLLNCVSQKYKASHFLCLSLLSF